MHFGIQNIVLGVSLRKNTDAQLRQDQPTGNRGLLVKIKKDAFKRRLLNIIN